MVNLNITERHAKFRRELHQLVENILKLRDTATDEMSPDQRQQHEKCVAEDACILRAVIELYDRYGDVAVLPQTALILDPMLDERPIDEDEEPNLSDDEMPYYEAFRREIDRILWAPAI